jgi:hypothetical protein
LVNIKRALSPDVPGNTDRRDQYGNKFRFLGTLTDARGISDRTKLYDVFLIRAK